MSGSAGGTGGSAGGAGAAAIGGAGGPGGASTPPWYGAADNQGYVENKGWKDAAAVIESYRGLERLQRTPRERILELPERDDDAEGWGKVHGRLGRPESPEKYDLPALQVADGQVDLSPEFRKWAHEAGLSNKAARLLVERFGGHLQGLHERGEQARGQQSELDLQGLRSEWGAQFDANLTAGKRAVQSLGWDAGTIDKLETALGTKGMLQLVARIGRGLGEHGFVGGDTAAANAHGGFGETPAAAQAAFEAKASDPAFMARLRSGDRAAQQEWDRLADVANQGRTAGGPPRR